MPPLAASRALIHKFEKLATAAHRHVFVVLLDTQNTIVRSEEISRLDPRLVYGPAFIHKAVRVATLQNHKGSPKPTMSEKAAVRRLRAGSPFLMIDYFDHIIVSPEGQFSFRENRLIAP